MSNGIDQTEGELFTRIYQRPNVALADSPEFRVRLGAYIENGLSSQSGVLAAFIRTHGGIPVNQPSYVYVLVELFEKLPVNKLLNCITLIWQCLAQTDADKRRQGNIGEAVEAKNWHAFVSKVFLQESLGYALDSLGGVHYAVDEAFERTKSSAVAVLGAARYAAVKATYDASFIYLDAAPMDTKAAVRSSFEALEILARLMVPESRNLNKGMIEAKLKPLLLAGVVEQTHVAVISKCMDSLGVFVDGIHYYRHGQGTETVVAPSIDVAIYILSEVGAALRWLALKDSSAVTAV